MERFVLSFRLGSTPVRVEPGFWLMAFVTGTVLSVRKPIAWIAVLFVCFLVHEMGHVLVARAYGAQVQIKLHWLGGQDQH